MKNLLLILLIFCSFLVKGQNNTKFEESLQKLEDYKNNFPREKVYLHLDKPYYSIGDQIWFKAYLTVGNYNFLSSLSKILYVELINSDEEIAISVRLPVINGITFGDILLVDSLMEGDYRIRAYTNWMRNFDERYFFDKTIQVGNALKNPLLAESSFSIEKEGSDKILSSRFSFRDLDDRPVSSAKVDYTVLSNKKSIRQGKGTTDENGSVLFSFKEPKGGFSGSEYIKTDIQDDKRVITKRFPLRNINQSFTAQFFPENGSNLIAEVLNKVSFKFSDAEGSGVEAKGSIVDADNKHVSDFESNFAGIGSLTFQPESNQTYKAVIKFADGRTEEANLPPVSPQGFILNANTWSADQVFIQITRNAPVDNNQSPNLILQKEGEVFYAAKIKTPNKETTISISKDKLPQGVVEARLISDDMQTLATKNIYIHNEQRELPIIVKSDKSQYGTRDLVKIQLTTGDSKDTMRVASLSVAVTDQTKVPVDTLTETTIKSYLTLSNETSQYVQSPGYYVSSQEYKIKSQLDDLVLTFEKDSVWNKLTTLDTLKPRYRPEQALQLSGMVTRLNGKPAPKAHVLVLAPGAGGIIDTVTDENGRFNFDRLLFYEDTKFVVQARDENGKKNVEIILDEVPRHEVTRNKNNADITLNMKQSRDAYLKNSKRRFDELIKSGKMDNSILLDDVNITVEKKNPAKNSSNLNGPGNADQVLGEDDLSKCSDLSICLQGRLSGVMFKQGIPYSTRSMNTPMQVIVDGMYMEGDALSMISAADVAAVEVLRRPGSLGIYGSMGAGGVIIVTTKIGNGNYTKNVYTPGVVTASPQGMYEIKEFQAPDYSNPANNPIEEDYRSTIYWNPNIITTESGEAAFEFFTADQAGRYRIVIEGIDLNGKLGRSETFIEVVKE